MGLKLICWIHKPDGADKCPVRLYVYRGLQKAYLGTDVSIDPDLWNPSACRVKPRHPNEASINKKISGLFNKMERIMQENPEASLGRILDLYNGDGAKTLIDFAEWFIKECESGKIKRSPGTIRNYTSCLNQIKDYNKEKERFDFNTLSIDLYNGWIEWLRSEHLLKDNTLGTRIKVLKTFINEAKERGITQTEEHKKKYFKKLTEETEKIYLEESEIKKFAKAKLPDHLKKERDRFMVSYYLLLRYSDSIVINRDSFFQQNGKWYYGDKAIKTKFKVVVPVAPAALEILQSNDYDLSGDSIFEANWKLKEIGSIAKIDSSKARKITTHSARRSGASNMYLAGIKPKTIMAMGGWKTEKAFMLYLRLDKLDHAREAETNRFFK